MNIIVAILVAESHQLDADTIARSFRKIYPDREFGTDEWEIHEYVTCTCKNLQDLRLNLGVIEELERVCVTGVISPAFDDDEDDGWDADEFDDSEDD